jgi:hypothetical protein
MLGSVAFRVSTLLFFAAATYGLARVAVFLLDRGFPLSMLAVIIAATWLAVGWATLEAWVGRHTST